MLSMPTRSAVVEMICAGTPREMGLAQGAAARPKIHAARLALAELEAFRIQVTVHGPVLDFTQQLRRAAAMELAGC